MPSEYVTTSKIKNIPRLPLEGKIDLTYRCNNCCRHCWLWLPADTPEKKDELSFAEIKKIVDEARKMGCRKWAISGGEPMLRPDFPEIFDYIARNCVNYTLNTNGALITPEIAKLMKRKGAKLVALYGATADIHDYITRSPGSFEAVMRGFAYLKEAGAGFMVQLIPMKDNHHQLKEMIKLAESLSKSWRIGAAWLYLSSCGSPEINKEIMRQRLEPEDVLELDRPDLSYEDWMKRHEASCYNNSTEGGYLFASCIANKRDFHIDPYGKMSFCCFIKDDNLRYDLKSGDFRECWEQFVPSLAGKIKIAEEYKQNCGSCELKKDCRWCPVYGYLEHRRFSAKVEHLCAIARGNRKYKEHWSKNHRRYYKIADITIQVEADLPIVDTTFHPKFKRFEVNDPGGDTISIRHHFSLPDLDGKNFGKKVYRKAPWAIYKNSDSWIYLGISPVQGDGYLQRVVVFNHDHTRAKIYNDKEETFLKGSLNSLTLFPTDQILLARILADRQACYLHACGVDLEGRGLLFAGHSEAGKSTMANLLKGKAEILCDDRMIIRRVNKEFRIYGTWSHGDVSDVSANSAPLKAILFLEKSNENQLIPITDRKETTKRLLSCLIRPFITSEWWDKTLGLVDKIAAEVPSYILRFDRSGEVIEVLRHEPFPKENACLDIG